MKIKWLKKALKNLADEAEYIAKDNPVAAKNVVKRIKSSIDLLVNNSSLGRSGRIHGTRELVIKIPPILFHIVLKMTVLKYYECFILQENYLKIGSLL